MPRRSAEQRRSAELGSNSRRRRWRQRILGRWFEDGSAIECDRLRDCVFEVRLREADLGYLPLSVVLELEADLGCFRGQSHCLPLIEPRDSASSVHSEDHVRRLDGHPETIVGLSLSPQWAERPKSPRLTASRATQSPTLS